MICAPISKLRSRRVSERETDRPSSPTHLRWVRTLPCCITKSPVGVIVHHLQGGDPSAMGARSGDDCAVPLAHWLHDAQYPGGLHRIGEAAFWALHGVDAAAIAERLWRASVRAGRVRSAKVAA